jgi:2',3'-cyclic-nucleotide 2'-phosphodiesterase (5'-nucleotidase family)
VPVVDSLTRTLRARGADYVVVVAHAGAFCDRDGATACNGEIIDFARALHEPVDAIVSGHTHSLVDATIAGIPVIQSRSSGTAFGVTDLGPGISVHHVYDVLPDTLTADSATAALVQTAVARVAPLVNRPVATIATDLVRTGSEYPLGNLIADAMRVEGKGDVAVMNNGGIRANLRAGPATYGALFEIQPFANVLYRITVTGSALEDYLEKLVARRPNVHVSGVVITYDSTAAAGRRIVSARLSNGATIRPDAQYALVLNDFLATGGDGLGLAAGAVHSEILPIVDLDAFVDYLRSLPQPVRAPTEHRLIATGAAR